MSDAEIHDRRYYAHYEKPVDEREAELFQWWMDTAEADFHAIVPKALEYGGGMAGSADLHVLGDALLTLLSERGVVFDLEPYTESVIQEMAIWFYLCGKTARLISDYRAGRPGKADTWLDIEQYAKMARRLQSHGEWP